MSTDNSNGKPQVKKRGSTAGEDACEGGFIEGERRVLLNLLGYVLRELGYESPEKGLCQAAARVAEREEAIVKLRELCADFGDNDWSDNAHLADVIDKHLGRHLAAEDEPEEDDDDIKDLFRVIRRVLDARHPGASDLVTVALDHYRDGGDAAVEAFLARRSGPRRTRAPRTG